MLKGPKLPKNSRRSKIGQNFNLMTQQIPACCRSLSGPSGPKRTRECPRKWGVSEGVSDGMSPCPKSVPRVPPGVSKRCLDTPGTLSGHPVGHCLGHPPFRGHSRDTPGTLRARRARETPVAGRRDRKNRSKVMNFSTSHRSGRNYPQNLLRLILGDNGYR